MQSDHHWDIIAIDVHFCSAHACIKQLVTFTYWDESSALIQEKASAQLSSAQAQITKLIEIGDTNINPLLQSMRECADDIEKTVADINVNTDAPFIQKRRAVKLLALCDEFSQLISDLKQSHDKTVNGMDRVLTLLDKIAVSLGGR